MRRRWRVDNEERTFQSAGNQSIWVVRCYKGKRNCTKRTGTTIIETAKDMLQVQKNHMNRVPIHSGLTSLSSLFHVVIRSR